VRILWVKANAVSICTGTTRFRALDYLVKLPKRAPYAVRRFASRVVNQHLKAWLRNFDVAVCDFLDAAVIPTILFQHDVDSEIWRRHTLAAKNGVKKLVYRLEYSKMRIYESRTVRKLHHVIAVTTRDRELMSVWVDPSHISIVSTGLT
jgi:hypothetical protein